MTNSVRHCASAIIFEFRLMNQMLYQIILPVILLVLSCSSCVSTNLAQEDTRIYEGFLGYGVHGTLRVEMSHRRTRVWISDKPNPNELNDWKLLGTLRTRKQTIHFTMHGNLYSAALSERNDTIDRPNRIDSIYLWIDQLNDEYPGWNAQLSQQ